MEARSSVPKVAIGFSHVERIAAHDYRKILELASVAEAAGVHQIVLSDHVAIARTVDDYPGGHFALSSDHPFPDPLVLLSAIAAVTSRVRLSTNILIAPLRPAVLLAKMVATLDRISDGRLDLGVGSGWHRKEFEAVGVPYERATSRLEDTVRACQALWRGGAASFSSESVSFTEMYCSPSPAQTKIPIWFGGSANRAVARRVAHYGDGWGPMSNASLEDVQRGWRLIQEESDRIGRNPSDVGVRAIFTPIKDRGTPDMNMVVAGILASADAGATVVQIPLTGLVDNMADVRPSLQHLMDTLAERTSSR